MADGGGGDRQSERYAHGCGDDYAHPEGLEHRRALDERADVVSARADGRGDERGEGYADEDGHERRDKHIYGGLLADHFADLGRDYGNDEHGERPARSAEGVRGPADRHEREQHERRTLERIAYGYGHGRTAHRRGVAADGGEDRHTSLRAERVEYRADEQRAEKALCHGSQRVYAIAPERELDVLPLQKRLEPGQMNHPNKQSIVTGVKTPVTIL